MRLFRKITYHCQNCVFSNNEKGKFIKTILRNSLYICEERGLKARYLFRKNRKYWHVFCEKKKKYFPWDRYKRCFIRMSYYTIK